MMSNINTGSNHGYGPVVESLARFLADTYALYLKTQNYHWNVEGAQFAQLHSLFEQQYNDLAATVDVIAERIRSLGAPAPGSFADFQRLGTLAPPLQHAPAAEMVTDLLAGQHNVIATARAVMDAARETGDAVTESLATDRIAEHEKTAWMLKSLTQGS